MKITSLTTAKAYLEIPTAETKWDTWLDTYGIPFVTDAVEGYLNRRLLDSGAKVAEYFDGGIRVLDVQRYPIVSGQVDVFEDWDSDFAADTELDEDDYRVLHEVGQVVLVGRAFIKGVRTVKVSYRGGFTETTGVLTSLPDSITRGFLMQLSYEWQRRKSLGASGQDTGGGSIQWDGEVKLLGEVRRTLDKARRQRVG